MTHDHYHGQLPTALDQDTVRQLSVLKTGRSIGQVILEWGQIIAAIALCRHIVHQPGAAIWISVPVYLATVVWIATRQHALGVLLHDAVHIRLCTNRAWNDFIGEWLLAWPLQVSLHGYRRQHFAHHRSVGNDDDPDYRRIQGVGKYVFPQTTGKLLATMLTYLSGFYAFHDGKETMEQLVIGIPASLQAKRVALYALVIAAAVYFNFWLALLLYWIVPSSTVLFLVLYIRLVAEHSALPRDGANVFTHTRHVDPAWWERLFLSPNHVNYHLDHHLYPSVPFYNLPALHARLLADPAYRSRAHITRGYLSGVLMRECRAR